MRLPRVLVLLTAISATALSPVLPATATPPAHVAAGPGNPLTAPAPVLRGVNLESATIPDLQRAMDRHQLSSAQLTAFYLARIQALDPRLHAVLKVNPDAVAQAVASDRRRRQHDLRGPLDGIPVLLKDNIDTADRQGTTAGSFALAGTPPARDAFLVGKLRRAGAVLIGKANLSEWANFRGTSSSSGWSAVGGQNNNPYVLDRNPSGSSAGSGSGISANLATVAIGTETHGSIVHPSGQNGIVGIRPTLGLISRGGVVPVTLEQDTAGPMARHLVDAALTLQVIRGVDPADPATAAAAPYDAVNYLRTFRPGALRGKRIGLWLAGTGGENVPAVGAIMTRVVSELRRLGATVVPADLPFQDQIGGPEFAAALVEFKHDIRAYLATRPGNHPKTLAELIAFNNAHAAVEMPFFGQETFEAAEATSGDLTDPVYRQQRRTATTLAKRSIDDTLTGLHLDAIIAPTNGPAWKTRLPGGDMLDQLVLSSAPAGVAGYPSVTVPAGFDGPFPIGVSFIGPRFGEQELLPLAYAYEQGTQARRPPTFIPTIG
ncbi:MAG TPA: amidase [Mycobacteriales bacterium]|nr:amidase [Mycobacteriales bacterium]